MKMKKQPKLKTFSTEKLLKIQETAKKIRVKRDKQYPGDLLGLRDYCCILIGIDCGPRRYQIINLNIDDYNDKNKTLRLHSMAGKIETTWMVHDIVQNALKEYLIKRKKIDAKSKAMFLTDNKKRITINVLEHRLLFVMEKAKVYEKGFGYQSLRRAKVYRLIKAVFPSRDISVIIGWKLTKMSEIDGMSKEELQKKVAEIDDIFKKD